LHINDEKYEWSYEINGKDIYFTCLHALSDGGGIFQFIHTILRMYYELKGETFEGNFALNDLSKIDETICDPYEKHADNRGNFVSEKKIDKKNREILIPKKLLTKDSHKVCVKQYVFDEDEIRRFSKEAGSTVSSVISVILAKGMARSIGAKKGIIKVGIPVNLRVITHSNTDRCFSITPELMYDIEKGEKNLLASESKEIKRQLDEYLSRDYLMGQILRYHNLSKLAEKHPTLLKCAALIYGITRYSRRAIVVYSHITKHGIDDQVLKHVKMIQILPRLQRIHWRQLAFAVTFNGKIYINLYSAIKENIWANKIDEIIKEYGITVE